MVLSCPQEIEDALWNAARARLPHEALAHLSQAVIERTLRYTSERQRLHEPLRGAARASDLAARALFFTVADAGKVSVPLGELHGRGLLPKGAPLRVADIGAGVGAMSLGLLAFLRRIGRLDPVELYAADQDADALALFAAAVERLPHTYPPVTVRTQVLDVAELDLAAEGFDLVLAGTVLNELTEHDARGLVRHALAALQPAGALVLIEPALRETSRDLHGLRDWALEAGLGHVFAPCVRRATPCPALVDEADWCHEERAAELPERATRTATATGLRSGAAKFSYLVLRRGDEGLVAAPDPGRAALRVVGQPRKLKGKVECLGCGEAGWRTVRLLRRNRSGDNRELERARRGEVLVVGERDDLERDDAVARIQPVVVDGA